MRVLIVGGGGREHALAACLSRSPALARLFVAPGNPGTAQVADNVAI
ncbi:phosphoribosylamine--glycine ligase, partial [Vibrio parahaemolyticus]